MESLQIFNYNASAVAFKTIDGEVYANATEMCKVFGKKPAEFLRLPNTIRYMEAIKVKCENPTSLFETKKGNSEDFTQGTWIHEKLILKLAQWLDVNFEIWCDEKIAELLRTGKTEIKPLSQLDILANSIKVLQEQELRLSKIERVVEENTKALESVDYSDNEVPSIKLRRKTSVLVNTYSQAKGLEFGKVWGKLYVEFLYRFRIDLKKRAKTKGVKPIDIAESEDKLQELFDLASNLFNN